MRSLLVSVFALCLIGAGCVRSSPPSDTFSYEYDKSDFIRDAAPEWRTIHLKDFSVRIPYSSQWRFSMLGLSVYDEERVSDEISLIRFGRPISGGTNISREYFLIREPLMVRQGHSSLEYLKDDLRCVDGFEARALTIGDRAGIEHNIGGAKGCSKGFMFHQGSHSYFLYRVPDMGDFPPDIDEEMKEILKSIKIR